MWRRVWQTFAGDVGVIFGEGLCCGRQRRWFSHLLLFAFQFNIFKGLVDLAKA